MRAANVRSSLSLMLLAIFCTGCLHHKTSPTTQAQAPPLQTGKGTLNPPKTAQQQEKTDTPLASPLPPPSAQNVPPAPTAHNKEGDTSPSGLRPNRRTLPRLRRLVELLNPQLRVRRPLRRKPLRKHQQLAGPPRPLVN